MRVVRCVLCGAKAMTAAAQCPRCGHLFELRDGFGELLPLAYCSGCESYYPESVGVCRWCGKRAERAPIGPQVWRVAGAAALVALVGTAWFLRSGEPQPPSSLRAKTAAKLASARPATDSAAARPAPTTVDSAPSAPVTASADSVGRVSTLPMSDVSAGSVVTDTAVHAAEPASNIVAAGSVASAIQLPPVTKPAPTKPVPSRQATRWVSSVSRHWVVVRSDASKESRIVASVGPNSRVQLGESRGTWRRIRAKGFAGWVEVGSSFNVATAR